MAGIDYSWSPTITPEHPGTVFGEMDFGDYASRSPSGHPVNHFGNLDFPADVSQHLRTPPQTAHNFCQNAESSGSFIMRTGCKGAGARECEPDPGADPEVAAQVDAAFQQILRQRVLSRHQKCPLSLFDLLQVQESPTARLRKRALARHQNLAANDEDEESACMGSHIAESEQYAVEGRLDVVWAGARGNIAEQNASAVLEDGDKQQSDGIADVPDDPPCGQDKEADSHGIEPGAMLTDEEALCWYSNRNWWLGGLEYV